MLLPSLARRGISAFLGPYAAAASRLNAPPTPTLFLKGRGSRGRADCPPGEGARSDNRNVRYLLEGNRAFIRKHLAEDPLFFKHLGEGQAPRYLYIGCSDSRVAAEDMFALPPGSMFVHRNIANLVISTDMSMLSVLQYAVQVLKVPHIIVCGHYECGGVKAAMQKQDLGLIDNWLRNIRDVYRIHRDELDGIESEGERFRRLVEINVQEQVLQVYKTGIVQEMRAKSLQEGGKCYATPRVHGLVFDPATGEVKKLPIDFKEHILAHRGIYDLYDVPSAEEADSGDLAEHEVMEREWVRWYRDKQEGM